MRSISGIILHIWNLFHHSFYKMIFYLSDMCDLFLMILINQLCRLTKPCNSRYIFCSGTHSLLLISTPDDWLYLCSILNINKSDSLWAVNLMPTYRNHICFPFLRVTIQLTICLNTIGME